MLLKSKVRSQLESDLQHNQGENHCRSYYEQSCETKKKTITWSFNVLNWFTGSPYSNAHNFYELFSIHSNSQTCIKKQWVCLSIFFTQLFLCCTSFKARNSLIRIFNMHHFTATIGKITYTSVLNFDLWVFDLFSNFSFWKLGVSICRCNKLNWIEKQYLKLGMSLKTTTKKTFLFA